MYLFLKLNDVEKVIGNISLDNECTPLVEGVAVAPRSTSVRQSIAVNTIPWFKSLAIDAVYIDIGFQDCRWVPKMFTEQTLGTKTEKVDSAGMDNSQSDAFFPISARPLFRHDGDMTYFDPLADELYERAEGILKKGMQEQKVRTECAQLLHCCVFPVVEFSKTDIPVLQGCSQRIALRIQSLEDDIREKEAELALTENILNRRKSKILTRENLCDEAKMRSCAPDFVNAFYDCLAKDIKDTYMQVELRQQKVQEERSRNGAGQNLEALVAERNATHERLQKLLTVRETLRGVLDTTHPPSSPTKKTRKKMKEEKSLHAAFVQIHDELKTVKAEANRLCYQRLYCAAMKKAIDASVRQIDKGRDASACDFSEFSLSVGVGVGGAEDRSGWNSMQDKVKEVIEQHGSRVQQEHFSRCQLVLDLVSSFLSDQAIATPGGTSNNDKIIDGVDESHCQMTQQQQGDGAERDGFCDSCSSGTFKNARYKALKSGLDHVMESVCDQLLGMAKVIVLYLGLDTENVRHLRRAWLCYVPHFCHVTLGRLEQAYTSVHAAMSASLYDNFTSCALNDIVDEGFFEEFFVQSLGRDDDSEKMRGGVTGQESTEAGDFQGQCRRSALSVEISALRLDLRRCSVSELYALADRDCHKLCCQMQELQQTDISSTSLSGSSNSSSSDLDTRPEVKGLDCGSSHSDSDGSSDDSDNATEMKVMTQLKKRVSPLEFVTSQAQFRRSVASLVAAFESVVRPFGSLMQEVAASPDLLAKLSLLYQGVSFLSQQLELRCMGRGMDSLLPMSILATVSLQKDIFVRLFVQLQLLCDVSHHAVLPPVYDFSLTAAYMPYFYLLERKTVLNAVESSA